MNITKTTDAHRALAEILYCGGEKNTLRDVKTILAAHDAAKDARIAELEERCTAAAIAVSAFDKLKSRAEAAEDTNKRANGIISQQADEAAAMTSELERLRKIESYRVEDKKVFDALRDNRNELEQQLAEARGKLAAANARLDEFRLGKLAVGELVAQVLALRQLIAGLCKAELASTQGGWQLRERGSDCFVERAKTNGEAYGVEILGDDYENRKGDALFIIAAKTLALAAATTHALRATPSTHTH